MKPIDFGVNEFESTNADPWALSSTLFGIPISQTWGDLMLWERFLNAHRLAHLIELGTGRGGLALFLALQARSRGFEITTIDSQAWAHQAGPLFQHVAPRCVQGDIFEQCRAILPVALQTHGAVCVFCDGGDKPLEFRTFAPMLRPGDFIAVHDYGVEFLPRHADNLPVRMLEAELCARNGSITRWFQVARA